MTPKADISIISGTHRAQDLLPAFLDALRQYSPEVYEGFMVAPFGPIPSYAAEDQNSDWWDSEEAHDLMGQMIEQLDEVAPDDCYFGTHPGDGSDYGFWTCEGDYL